MHISTLPDELQNIQDDGRGNEEIIAAFEAKGIVVFFKDMFMRTIEPIPFPGTVYQFVAVHSKELPEEMKSNAGRIFAGVTQEHANLRKPPLRAALFLQERMTREQLYADTIMMNEPVPVRDGRLGLVVLSREYDEATSWIGAYDADDNPTSENALFMFIAAPPA